VRLTFLRGDGRLRRGEDRLRDEDLLLAREDFSNFSRKSTTSLRNPITLSSSFNNPFSAWISSSVSPFSFRCCSATSFFNSSMRSLLFFSRSRKELAVLSSDNWALPFSERALAVSSNAILCRPSFGSSLLKTARAIALRRLMPLSPSISFICPAHSPALSTRSVELFTFCQAFMAAPKLGADRRLRLELLPLLLLFLPLRLRLLEEEEERLRRRSCLRELLPLLGRL